MKKEELKSQFESLDLDGSGLLDAKEILASMPQGDQHQARQVLEMMDTDGDGRVSFKEFLSFYRGDFESDKALSESDSSIDLGSLSDLDGDGLHEISSD